MIQAIGVINNCTDPEYLRILRELAALGIAPSGNKTVDKNKLETAKAELVQQIQERQVEESKRALQVQPLEAAREAQQAQLETERLGAKTVAELNKLYFGLA